MYTYQQYVTFSLKKRGNFKYVMCLGAGHKREHQKDGWMRLMPQLSHQYSALLQHLPYQHRFGPPRYQKEIVKFNTSKEEKIILFHKASIMNYTDV